MDGYPRRLGPLPGRVLPLQWITPPDGRSIKGIKKSAALLRRRYSTATLVYFEHGGPGARGPGGSKRAEPGLRRSRMRERAGAAPGTGAPIQFFPEDSFGFFGQHDWKAQETRYLG